MTNDPDTLPPQAELQALLPWYANGRINAADRARVAAALAADPALRESLGRVEEELADTVALNEGLGAPSARAGAELFARIAAEGRRPAPSAGGLLDRIAAALAALTPRTLAWSAAAAALVIVLQAGVLTSTLVAPETRYETASGPGQGVGEGSFALVAFAPEANAAAITQALEAVRAVIVDGPLPGGLFRLRISDRQLPAAEYDQALAALRARSAVIRMVVPSR